ncbi:MAG: porphobilinogen synthase [Saprospiraceae bacterium]
MSTFPLTRHRRLRTSPDLRDLVAETQLHRNDLVVPLFVTGEGPEQQPIDSMPGYFRYAPQALLRRMEDYMNKGLTRFILFAKISTAAKDNTGLGALDPSGLFPAAIAQIKSVFPECTLFTDIALDPYSSYGHDGLVKDGEIVNDPTVEVLAQMAVLHAASGADFVAPSDMMDGRVLALRRALDKAGYLQTGILAYSAKYASAFYGPFRDALDSAPGFGDKSTYQMDYRNAREAIKETLADIEEGADLVMVKPALAYLDIITRIRAVSPVPIAAYQVSGEYSMIKAAAEKGWLQEERAIQETLIAIKRAGADVIITYFAEQTLPWLS